MESTLLIPLLFPMEPAFEDLHDGGRIRVVRPDGEHVGVMLVTRLPDPPRFGMIIQFRPAAEANDSTPPASNDREFVATGHCGLPVHRTTLEELRRIERVDDADTPFTLTASPA